MYRYGFILYFAQHSQGTFCLRNSGELFTIIISSVFWPFALILFFFFLDSPLEWGLSITFPCLTITLSQFSIFYLPCWVLGELLSSILQSTNYLFNYVWSRASSIHSIFISSAGFFSFPGFSNRSSCIPTYSCPFLPSSFGDSKRKHVFTVIFILLRCFPFIWRQYTPSWLLWLAAFLHISFPVSFLFLIHGDVDLSKRGSLPHVSLSLGRRPRMKVKSSDSAECLCADFGSMA